MFDFAQQADTLGNYVARFASLAKRLNAGMDSRPETRQYIDSVIGSGRFNRAATNISDLFNPEELTVLYGDDLRRARSQNKEQYHGLFAALHAIHHPLLGFVQNLLIDLGKQGFTCVVTHGGGKIIIPLHLLKIDFDGDGRIFTKSPITVGDKMLPAKYVLLDNMGAELYPVASKGKLYCDIMDANNASVGFGLVPRLLWIGIAGKGKNIYDDGSSKDRILTRLGIDDMEEANRLLVDAVDKLESDHHYNPMPLWNNVMASARHQLMPHLPSLSLVRESIAYSNQSILPPIMRNIVEDPYNTKTIDNLTNFFGVTLPELNEQQRRTAHAIAAGLTSPGR